MKSEPASKEKPRHTHRPETRAKQESQSFKVSRRNTGDSFHISPTNILIVLSTSQLLQMQCLQRQWMQQARSLLPQQQPPMFFFAPQQPIQPPLNVGMNPLLEQVVLAIQHWYTPDKSNGIYDHKPKEYFQYCNYCHPMGNYTTRCY
jgi:hypothetical protein